MKGWNAFLDSLATRGGAVLTLLLVCAATLGVLLWLQHHGQDGGSTATTVAQTFAGFSGALLIALKGGDKPDKPTAPIPPGDSVG